MSPRIELEVESLAFDEKNLILYVSLSQVFRIWIIPFFAAHVHLTTVLRLIEDHATTTVQEGKKRPKYLIQSQNDLYQVTEFVKFVSWFGILRVLVLVAQLVATGLCVIGAGLLWPVSWVEQNVVGGNRERGFKEVVDG
ncbi:uncharacterized protein KY384_007090 [Bacidia gigantensis]|uniref:uncharacterized protein n=1 Tax=Bacidia gigantensis TaxID=2732470 RepID=UPI001D055B5D|nr:uncharacterized protein KY384_007090 [Bacidia gigantensis]KAG8528173.1 hypothetical protein KY384_007090 [Bacidia gigantensis]